MEDPLRKLVKSPEEIADYFGSLVSKNGDFGIRIGKILIEPRFNTYSKAIAWGRWNYKGGYFEVEIGNKVVYPPYRMRSRKKKR